MLSIPIVSEFDGKGIKKAIAEFKQLQTIGCHFHHAEIRNHHVDHTNPRQRQGARWQQLQVNRAILFMCDVLHQHNHTAYAGNQVHRAAHALNHLAWDHPVS